METKIIIVNVDNAMQYNAKRTFNFNVTDTFSILKKP